MNRKERRRQNAKQRDPIGTSRAKPGLAALQPSRPQVAAPIRPPRPARPPNPTEVPPGWVRSGLSDVVWPAFQSGIQAEALAIQFQFEQTQWWSPERIRAHQFAQLAELVRHAGRTVPFYRERFKAIGFDPRAPLDEAALSKLPLLTRGDIQESFEALLSEHYPKSHGLTGETGTSGSTGTPIKVKKTRLQQLLWEAGSLRDHLWQRRDLSGQHATIVTPSRIGDARYPDGLQVPTWGGPVAPFHSGPASFLEIATTIDRQAEWLVRMKPTYLNTYPSNLEALAHHFGDSGMTLPSLQGLRTSSEILRPETRRLCRAVFGVEIADMYSSAEVGYMALQSPVSEELLIQAETILVEVLDEDGGACGPGQIGRVVVTPLHAFAMPLIRYASGDLAEVGGPASCGRGLPVLARVIGRERQMISFPTGSKMYPMDLIGLVKGIGAVRQLQIVQTTQTHLEMRLVARAPLDDAQQATIRAQMIERFKYPFELSFVYVDTIAREPNGKFLDFKSEVG